MVNIKRGNVVLCDLNPVKGSEQAGIRPAVVLQIDKANAVSPITIILPFTTTIKKTLLRSHILIPAGIGGLEYDSVLLCEQIRVIDRQRILKVIGSLNKQYMKKVEKSVKIILGL